MEVTWTVRTVPNETQYRERIYNVEDMDELPDALADVKARIIEAMSENIDPSKGLKTTVNEAWGRKRFKVPLLVKSRPEGSIVLLTLDRNDGAGPKPIMAKVLPGQVVEIIAEATK